jgi:hypothetical protein
MFVKRLFIIVWILGSCVAWAKPPDVPSRVCKELSKTYFKQSRQEMNDSLAGLDLERQYEIYVCGSQYIHPPILGLVKPFAAQGTPVVNLLRRKLVTVGGDLTVRDIVRVLVEMKRQQVVDARNDVELMGLLDARIEKMKSPEWREITRQMYLELAQ